MSASCAPGSLRRLGDAHEADDLLQDLFIKALGRNRQFCEMVNARAWLFAVARNTLTDHLRPGRTTWTCLTICQPTSMSRYRWIVWPPAYREHWRSCRQRTARHSPSAICRG